MWGLDCGGQFGLGWVEPSWVGRQTKCCGVGAGRIQGCG